jgi:hypothetical protein
MVGELAGRRRSGGMSRPISLGHGSTIKITSKIKIITKTTTTIRNSSGIGSRIANGIGG